MYVYAHSIHTACFDEAFLQWLCNNVIIYHALQKKEFNAFKKVSNHASLCSPTFIMEVCSDHYFQSGLHFPFNLRLHTSILEQ